MTRSAPAQAGHRRGDRQFGVATIGRRMRHERSSPANSTFSLTRCRRCHRGWFDRWTGDSRCVPGDTASDPYFARATLADGVAARHRLRDVGGDLAVGRPGLRATRRARGGHPFHRGRPALVATTADTRFGTGLPVRRSVHSFRGAESAAGIGRPSGLGRGVR